MADFEKYQGESLAFKRGLQIDGVDENLTAGWTCRLVVKPLSGGLSGTASIDKAITEQSDTNTRFVVRITPTEMAGLDVGQYHVITEMINAASGINDESHNHLTVTEQGAA